MEQLAAQQKLQPGSSKNVYTVSQTGLAKGRRLSHKRASPKVGGSLINGASPKVGGVSLVSREGADGSDTAVVCVRIDRPSQNSVLGAMSLARY